MEKKTLYGVDKAGNAKQWSVWSEGDQLCIEWGKVGGKLTQKKTVCVAKNVGKANETTPEEQAHKEALAKYDLQFDKYYRPTVEEAAAIIDEGVMLAQDYTKKPHYLDDWFYVSDKLDGLRVKTVRVDDRIEWRSRGNKVYPIPDHIYGPLKQVMDALSLDMLDGEAYIHGVSLQNIQSCVKKPKNLTKRVSYHLFDVPMLSGNWEHRLGVLDKIEYFLLKHLRKAPVKVLDQKRIHKSKLDEALKDAISRGFEGVMMRNSDGGEYLFQNKRSNDLLKYKLFEDSECQILEVESDKDGQAKFLVEWKSKKTKKMVTFHLSLNGSKDINTYENLKDTVGQWINFSYQDFTDEGLPTFARGKSFRDCDPYGNPLE
ncbi:DNA ligase [Pseudoalteromonas phage J2-1_QLiu-2017]|nr:DNA ligase [Pseudoalteromonas phage J2-1_QLiu-2017]